MPIIKDMLLREISAAANIHREVFPNDSITFEGSYQWILSKYFGWPVNRYFAAVDNNEVIGYILWVEMGGLRKECVLELEQLAVAKKSQARGVGTQLINESLYVIAQILHDQGRLIKLVEVTTGSMNEVQRLYTSTLGAEVECKKRNFFDEDEVVMIARHSAINLARRKRKLPLIPDIRSVT